MEGGTIKVYGILLASILQLCWKHDMEIQVVEVADAAWLLADASLCQRIDALGEKSVIAQQLARPITSAELFARHAATQQQRLLLAVVEGHVVGFLKSGVKHLFYINRKGVYSEMDPLCVLDFYVAEDFQRRGVGVQLFSRLLENHRVTAAQLAYDRPSPKLFSFLKKYAQLVEFVPQPNNFVIFDEYFTTTSTNAVH